LRSAGLPYAQDAGITRHLAAFLSKQKEATHEFAGNASSESASFLHPTAVLFNGGVLKAQVLAERLMAILNSWLQTEQAPEARLLQGAELDLAVARGAAYYGFVRQGKGVRIKGGTAASYYVGVESAMPAVPGLAPEIEALCIAPFGMEEGSEQALPNDEFGLIIGEPVRFRFLPPKPGGKIRSALGWKPGMKTNWKNWMKSRLPCRKRGETLVISCRFIYPLQ
jgi:hypothetical protein